MQHKCGELSSQKKVKQIENCQNKMGLKEWNSLNAPGIKTPLSHPVLELGDFPFLTTYLALWGKKNWPPSIKVKQIENLQNKLGLEGWKWSSLNGPGTQVPLSQVLLVFYECDPFSRLVFLSLTARARPPALARSLFIWDRVSMSVDPFVLSARITEAQRWTKNTKPFI